MTDKKPQNKSKKPIALILFALVTLGNFALSGYTLLEVKKGVRHAAAETEQAAQDAEAEAGEPIYLPLEAFTVSITPSANETETDAVLHIGLTLQLKDDASRQLAEAFMPEIRSRLLLLLSQQNAKALSTQQGKDALTAAIRQTLSQPIGGKKTLSVTDVLYTAFILR